MNNTVEGFREIEHTADRELEVWAKDLAGLLKQAARGMYKIANLHLDDQLSLKRSIFIEAFDPETLLVKFLTELLYFLESESISFNKFEFDIQDYSVHAHLSGAASASSLNEIKAVTYHNLKITQGDSGLRAHIVFDV